MPTRVTYNRDREVLDLIRVGVFAQLEGNFIESGNNNNYRFRFYTNQIEDMKDLVSRVSGKPPVNSVVISVSSNELYQKLRELGFYRFNTDNWNLPRVGRFSAAGRVEYLRAVIDAIGNVDVDKTVPVVKLSSINRNGLSQIANAFKGGALTGPYDKRWFLAWKGSNAIDVLNYLDWRFNNRRNQRGAELIRAVRWSDYLV